jgi:hypothetical protein
MEPVYLYASQSGRPTFDQGEGGGNPFASALVDLLAHPTPSFAMFRTELIERTLLKSEGFQQPEISGPVEQLRGPFSPTPPFRTKQGAPYLEAHHIEWLARGGADTLANTVALCPNCHRKMHALDREEDRRRLTGKVAR